MIPQNDSWEYKIVANLFALSQNKLYIVYVCIMKLVFKCTFCENSRHKKDSDNHKDIDSKYKFIGLSKIDIVI